MSWAPFPQVPKEARPAAPDQAERERLSGPDVRQNAFIEAAAGAGKTTLMVERIYRRIALGIKPDRIVAVTFGEAMAADLKAKLRKKIEEHQPDALAALARSEIGTIHAFAATLLRAHAFEAGVDPGFQVLDQRASELAREMIWDEEWLNFLEGESAEEIVPLLEESGVDKLEEACTQAALLLSRQPDLAWPLPRKSFEDLIQKVRLETELALKALETLKSLATPEALAGKTDPNAKAQKVLDQLAQLSTALPPLGKALESAMAGLQDPPELKLPNVSQDKSAWKSKSVPEDFTTHNDELESALDRLKRVVKLYRRHLLWKEYWDQGIRQLLERARLLADRYADWKRRHGYLDFDDLLILARNLLSNSPAARRRIAASYDLFVVDEVHDVDPLQHEIMLLAASDPSDERKPLSWDQATLRSEVLTLVGDPKQSIFRFRHADLGQYLRMKKDAETRAWAAVTEKICANFRSVPEIADWVNGVFDPLLTSGSHAFVPMKSGRHQAGAESVHLLEIEGLDCHGDKTAGMREQEAQGVARVIEAVRRGDGFPEPADRAERRSYDYGDIAIVYRKGTAVPILERALREADIPYALRAGKALYRAEEVRTLAAVLRAVDDAGDREAEVAALVHAFGCSWDDLVLDRAGQKRDAVEKAREVLQKLRYGRRGMSPDRVVEEVLDRTQLPAIYAARRQGERRVGNLYRIRDEARAIAALPEGSYHRFVRILSRRMRDQEDAEEQLLADESGNAVTLTTVHSAKGLEWPVVILIDPFDLDSGRTKKVIQSGSGLEMKFSDRLGSAGSEEAQAGDKTAGEEETRRLFYVACTRAMDHLVIPMAWGDRKKSFLGRLLGDGGEFGLGTKEGLRLGRESKPWLNGVRVVEAADLPQAAGGAAGGKDPSAPVPPDAWPAWSSKAGKDYVPWAIHAPEDIAARLGAAAADPLRDVKEAGRAFVKPEEVRRWEAALSGTPEDPSGDRLGTAVHRVLETLEFPRRSGGGFDVSSEEARAAALKFVTAEEGLTDPEARWVRDHVDLLLGSSDFRALLGKAKRVLKEVPFVLPDPSDGKRLIPGRIDLLLELEEEWVIVDYKTGRPDPRGWLEQLLLYKVALSKRRPDRRWRACVLHVGGTHATLLEVQSS